jgi:CheY-like chemotaxis protein
MVERTAKRILVVDDEADVRRFITMALQDAGFEVEAACDGLEALQKIERQPPDLITLDLVMPKHSGAKLYRDLRKRKELKRIPVIIITGHAHDEVGKADLESLTMSGVGIYLEKPVNAQSLVAAVRKSLGLETPEPAAKDAQKLKAELEALLEGADPAELERMLRKLKEKKQ